MRIILIDFHAFNLTPLGAARSLKLNAGTAIDRRLVFAEALVLMSDGSENSDEQPSVDRRR